MLDERVYTLLNRVILLSRFLKRQNSTEVLKTCPRFVSDLWDRPRKELQVKMPTPKDILQSKGYIESYFYVFIQKYGNSRLALYRFLKRQISVDLGLGPPHNLGGNLGRRGSASSPVDLHAISDEGLVQETNVHIQFIKNRNKIYLCGYLYPFFRYRICLGSRRIRNSSFLMKT